MHADIADTRFPAKSAIDQNNCFLLVDLFTSKVYVYSMKNRSLLLKKLRLFYQDIDKKRTVRMRLQTDLEFKQNIIHNLKDVNYYANIIYRNRNNLFMKDFLTGKWFGTSENLFLEATNYATKTKTPFNVSNFWGIFTKLKKRYWICDGDFE